MDDIYSGYYISDRVEYGITTDQLTIFQAQLQWLSLYLQNDITQPNISQQDSNIKLNNQLKTNEGLTEYPIDNLQNQQDSSISPEEFPSLTAKHETLSCNANKGVKYNEFIFIKYDIDSWNRFYKKKDKALCYLSKYNGKRRQATRNIVITSDILRLNQKEAATKLGMSNCTLSKKWTESNFTRKWPARRHLKIMRKIELIWKLKVLGHAVDCNNLERLNIKLQHNLREAIISI